MGAIDDPEATAETLETALERVVSDRLRQAGATPEAALDTVAGELADTSRASFSPDQYANLAEAVAVAHGLAPDAIDRLRAKLKGRLIVPPDPSYESARRVFYWNSGTERRPRVIVQCATEQDALRAVEFARRHKLEVAARAGGHSHLGWGCSNGLVIDLSGMKRIAIDPLRRTVRAEGGVSSGEVAQAAVEHGLAMVLTGIRHFKH